MTMAMKPMTDEQLLDLESAYWDALKTRNARAASRMTDPECTIVGASGVTAIDTDSIAKLVESAPYTIRDYRIDPKTARIVRFEDDAVAISYGVHEELEVEGKPVRLDAFDASVWKRSGDTWSCVLHTESIAGDAFGRDRTATATPA